MATRKDINEGQMEKLPLAEALEAERKAKRNARARQRRAEKKAKKEFWARTNRNVEWLDVNNLEFNVGQMEGLPKNPRTWTKDELNKLKKSLQETPELFEARPILAYDYDGRLLVLGGNMRLSAAKALGLEKVPVYVYPSDTSLEKLKEIVIKDNGAFGAWDWDMLANEWDALPLSEWGVPTWKVETGLAGELPSELDGQDLTPDDLQDLAGDDEVEMERVIIVYPKEREGEVAERLGLEGIEKVLYSIDELGR